MEFICTHILVVGLVVTLLAAPVEAQERELPDIRTTPLAENVYMLAGAGGNIAVCVGDDGVLVVDSEYAQLADKLVDAVRSLSDKPIRFLVNTHWHLDHVGGNERLAGLGATIVAHENVRKRMSTEQQLMDRTFPPSPEAALPTQTYTDRLTLEFKGEDVILVHPAPAHTDGDTFVYFMNANVLHVGDVCFYELYPFIDVNAGGSVDGMIAAVDLALKMANDETKIIPGHGELTNAAGLREYRKVLVTTRDRVRKLIDEGKTRDEVIAARPTADMDAASKGGMTPERFVGVVYDGMVDGKD